MFDPPFIPAPEYLHAMEPDSDLFSLGALGTPEATEMRKKLHDEFDRPLEDAIQELRKDT